MYNKRSYHRTEVGPISAPSLYIATKAELDAFEPLLKDALARDARLAFDTEFIRERTYAPVLEIVQVAVDGGELIAILDVPALQGDLGPVGEALLDPAFLKIVHAGGQDMEILAARLGRLPEPVYDTQIAAAFAGHSLQMGYGALVQALLNVRLAKDEGFADWSRRPLTPAMRDYAENDVRYLHAIHDKLSKQLERKGRSDWAADQMRRTLTQAAEEVPVGELWRKVGGKNVLEGQGLAILRELARWRDEEARRRDKPRRSVVKDDLLVEVARRGTTDSSAILGLRTAPPNLGERAATAMAEAVKRGKEVPKHERPMLESVAPLDEQGAVLLELMSAVVRLKAMEESLPPALLANGDDLRALAAGRSNPDYSGPLFSGWRGSLIGDSLRDLIAGNLVLGYDPRRRRVTLTTAPRASSQA